MYNIYCIVCILELAKKMYSICYYYQRCTNFVKLTLLKKSQGLNLGSVSQS